jgi:hypothetical protein
LTGIGRRLKKLFGVRRSHIWKTNKKNDSRIDVFFLVMTKPRKIDGLGVIENHFIQTLFGFKDD